MSAAWRVLGASVRGDSHRRSGAPNQDAIALIPGERGPTIVAVADGHGSAESFRSDAGSAFAVRVATSAARAFFAEIGGANDAGDVERHAKDSLVPRIVSGWTDAVNADLAERPITEDDVARLRDRGIGTDPTADPLVVYGATLVMAAAADSTLLLMQIGDGDVLSVSDRSGGAPTAARPVPKDPRLVGNQTTSLCLPEAVDDFRVRAIDLRSPDAPSLVVVSTDGYANSFVNDGAFLQAGPDILARVQENGLDWVGEQLPAWLDGASKHGSGDDITMGLLVRSKRPAPGDVAEPFAPTLRIPRAVPSGWARRSAIGAAIALIAGFLLGRALDGSGSTASPPPATPTSTASPSAQTDASGTQWIWAKGTTLIELSDGKPTLSSIEVTDLKGKTVTDTAFGFDRIWVTTDDGLLLVVDPVGPTARSVDLPSAASQIVIGPEIVTLISTDGKSYFVVDPTAHSLEVEQSRLPGPGSAA